jgi:hypothetical protein
MGREFISFEETFGQETKELLRRKDIVFDGSLELSRGWVDDGAPLFDVEPV